MNNELVKLEKLPIKSMSEMAELGTMLAKSGMFGAKNPAEGLVIATTCFQENMSLMQFISTYHIIQGKPAMKADAMLANFIGKGGKVNWITTDNTIAKAEFTAPNGSILIETFSIEDARIAGLDKKDNWIKYTKSMLRSRCISSALRAIYPISTNCVYTPEEVENITNEINVTPQKTPEPMKKESIKETIKEAAISAFPKSEPDPFDIQIEVYTKCPLPGKLFDVKWENMPLESLRIAEKMKHETLMAGHYQSIHEAINKIEGIPF